MPALTYGGRPAVNWRRGRETRAELEGSGDPRRT